VNLISYTPCSSSWVPCIGWFSCSAAALCLPTLLLNLVNLPDPGPPFLLSHMHHVHHKKPVCHSVAPVIPAGRTAYEAVNAPLPQGETSLAWLNPSSGSKPSNMFQPTQVLRWEDAYPGTAPCSLDTEIRAYQSAADKQESRWAMEGRSSVWAGRDVCHGVQYGAGVHTHICAQVDRSWWSCSGVSLASW
jgi:hypothetical protein